MFTVEFYETADGDQPIFDFLNSLEPKMRSKLVGLLEVLGEKGTSLRLPYSEHLDDGIFELRCKQGSNITRALYFFYTGKKIIVTNGFVKKGRKTPKREIQIAKARRVEWSELHQFTEWKDGE